MRSAAIGAAKIPTATVAIVAATMPTLEPQPRAAAKIRSGVRKYKTIAKPDWAMTPDDISAEASPAAVSTPIMAPLNFITSLSCSGLTGLAVRGGDTLRPNLGFHYAPSRPS